MPGTHTESTATATTVRKRILPETREEQPAKQSRPGRGRLCGISLSPRSRYRARAQSKMLVFVSVLAYGDESSSGRAVARWLFTPLT